MGGEILKDFMTFMVSAWRQSTASRTWSVVMGLSGIAGVLSLVGIPFSLALPQLPLWLTLSTLSTALVALGLSVLDGSRMLRDAVAKERDDLQDRLTEAEQKLARTNLGSRTKEASARGTIRGTIFRNNGTGIISRGGDAERGPQIDDAVFDSNDVGIDYQD